MKCDVVVAIGDNSPYLGRCLRGIDAQGIVVGRVLIIINNKAKINYFRRFLSTCGLEVTSKVEIIEATGAQNANIARNVGLLSATAPFVAFLDVDDEWMERHLEESIAEIEKESAIGCYSGMIVHRGGDETAHVSYDYRQEPNMETYLIKKNPAPTSSLVVVADAVRNCHWNWALRRHQDYDYLARLVNYGHLASKTNITLRYFDTGNANKQFSDTFKVLSAWKGSIEPALYKSHRKYLFRKLLKNLELRSAIYWFFKS